MKNVICFIITWFPFICLAQTYKYLSTANGLSNQKIYRIQKGELGYMWFLTHQGIDRYNGKEIKHYKLIDPFTNIDTQTNLDWIYADRNERIWVIGNKGRIFRYDFGHDCFRMVYKTSSSKKKASQLCCGYMDRNDRIWLCCQQKKITLYDTRTSCTSSIESPVSQRITAIEQVDSLHFFVGTEKGLFYARLEKNRLRRIPCPIIDTIQAPISELFFHDAAQKLFIGTFRSGVLAYNLQKPYKLHTETDLSNVDITRFAALDAKQVLVGTDGRGVYRMNVDSCNAIPYITANYNSYNEMNGNAINDIYVDKEQRIWLANYPNGITIRDNRYINYSWIKHSIGNRQSLVNNQVHSILEDYEGDLWFGTSNGISLYNTHTGTWHSFISSFDKKSENKNHIFLTLCEVEPGIIWAGGYVSGLYQIRKADLSVQYYTPSTFFKRKVKSDQYIRAITKDTDGYIWSGGYNHLKCTDFKHRKLHLYSELKGITSIIEKDRQSMWIGTASGLYLLEKKSGRHQYIDLPVESNYICTLYQQQDTLYIGTNGSGLLVYRIQDRMFTRYYTGNSPLISNNIYTILPCPDGTLLLATEKGITKFSPKEMEFHNWTKEHGLMSVTFNAASGILRRNNQFAFGSDNGVICFPADIVISQPHTSPIILSDLMISYQTVYPGEKGSPLKKDINQTKQLKLKYGQNTFSLKVSSINYDSPSDILYSWKLDGFYNHWSRPSQDGNIRFTKLSPGSYTLHVRSISNEERYRIYEERNIHIIVEPPLWAGPWAITVYILLFVLASVILFRLFLLKREKELSEEKTQFFIHTAHDIRTPLTLVKAPLEEMREKKQVNADSMANIQLALRNVDMLLRLANNLVSLEKTGNHSSRLQIGEYELGAYITDLHRSFLDYTASRNMRFTLDTRFSYLNVWFDKSGMDSILNNLISNAIKYTPEGGSVSIVVSESEKSWSVEITDTGIGIPARDQKHLFKLYFRGSNAINRQMAGSGIGLMLVYKLVRLHKGSISIDSVEQKGTCVRVTFPKGKKQYRKSLLLPLPYESKETPEKKVESYLPPMLFAGNKTPAQEKMPQENILIVEDNDDLRNYLANTLSEEYKTASCANGKEALTLVEDFNPALIISDIMMPEMSGDDLCKAIKNDIRTSHIPVILLTALGDESHIIKGLETGADDYIAKPFSIGILKASIRSLLINRTLLHKKYGALILEENADCELPSKDWEFMAAVKKNIETNLTQVNFNIDTLCAMHNMSRSSFFNKLKTLTGHSPSELIRLIRLQHASRLLQQGYNQTEVADLCGFCDAKYFRTVFKKHFKESPSQHAKKGMNPKQPDENNENLPKTVK